MHPWITRAVDPAAHAIIQGNIFWNRFLYQFWHHVRPFWHQFSILVRHRFLNAFLDAIFSIFMRKWLPKGMVAESGDTPFPHPFHDLFRILIFSCILVARWLTFGSLWLPLAPFWFPLDHFWCIFFRRCRGSLPISRFRSPCFKWPVSLGCGGVALRLQ